MKWKLKRKITRLINSVHTYDYDETQDGWIKSSGPINGLEVDTTYFDPYIYLADNQLSMYVSNRKRNCIDKYISTDGIKWKYCGVALSSGLRGEWDERTNRACVLLKNGVYHMWYTGQNKFGSQIGLALSYDGLTFTRINKNSIIEPQKDFERNNVMNPCVLWDEDKSIFKMWYAAGEQYEPDCICYAESYDGVLWIKREKPIIEKSANKYDQYKVGGCDVHYSNNMYTMYYIGYQDIDNARICMAQSRDGIHWTRDKNNPIISPSRSSWDANSVYKPSLVNLNNRLILYYNGRNKDFETIGYAFKETKSDFR